MVRALLAISFVSSSITAFACTCVTANLKSTTKTVMADDAAVFQDAEIERETLPSRAEIR
jgi:hypothetical protein